MRIPLTSPNVPEADALSVDERRSVMREYAGSADAGRFILWARVGAIVSLMLIISPFVYITRWSLLPSLAGLLLLIVTFGCYRVAAGRAIRRMIAARDARKRAA